MRAASNARVASPLSNRSDAAAADDDEALCSDAAQRRCNKRLMRNKRENALHIHQFKSVKLNADANALSSDAAQRRCNKRLNEEMNECIVSVTLKS
jgi:hypothetical protein